MSPESRNFGEIVLALFRTQASAAPMETPALARKLGELVRVHEDELVERYRRETLMYKDHVEAVKRTSDILCAQYLDRALKAERERDELLSK